MAEPTAPKKPETKTRATKRNFSAIVANVHSYVTMKAEVLAEVGGSSPSDFCKGQLSELKAVLAKLESK